MIFVDSSIRSFHISPIFGFLLRFPDKLPEFYLQPDLDSLQILKDELAQLKYHPIDLGTHGADSVDYPDFAKALAGQVLEKHIPGILICGSGIGMSIAANRHPGIRAALCHDGLSARLAREHNDGNVLVLGERLIGVDVAKECVRVFFSTPFSGGRHQRRVEKMG